MVHLYTVETMKRRNIFFNLKYSFFCYLQLSFTFSRSHFIAQFEFTIYNVARIFKTV